VEKKVSRQRAWQAKMQANGMCSMCGDRLAPGSRSRCPKHLKQDREASRKAHGYHPWKRGGRGRPPIGNKEAEGQDENEG